MLDMSEVAEQAIGFGGVATGMEVLPVVTVLAQISTCVNTGTSLMAHLSC